MTDNDIPTLPNNKYNVIYIDPPWKFKTYSDKGLGKSPEKHYPCMTTSEIAKLPIGDLASDNCAMFMWCTWPTLLHPTESPIHLFKAWNFEYKSLAWEWVKFNPVTKKFAFGGGYGTRKNCEPCILATRGSPKRKSASVRDFVFDDELDVNFSERREHSRKPDNCYDKIEALFDGPYVEIFARNRRQGWDSWGNEVDKFSNSVLPL